MKTPVKSNCKDAAAVRGRILSTVPAREVFNGEAQSDLDLNLADLSHGVGILGAYVCSNAQRPMVGGTRIPLDRQLKKILGFLVGWLAGIENKVPADLIMAERVRQESLWDLGKLSCSVSSTVCDDKRKLRVLLEEVGEVAKAIDEIEMYQGRSIKLALDQLVTELVQSAAVTLAWLESLAPAGEVKLQQPTSKLQRNSNGRGA